jgi:hypothetical protein
MPIGEVVAVVSPLGVPVTADHLYCNNSKAVMTTNKSLHKFACRMWDQHQFVFDPNPNSIFLTTAVNISHQIKCTKEPCAEPWEETHKTSFYVSQVEDYELKFTTTFQAQRRSDDLKNMTYYLHGQFVDQAGDTVADFPPMHSDAISVKNLLNASGIASIDDTSDWSFNTAGLPYRALGALVSVSVQLDNRNKALLGDPKYVYKAIRAPNKKYLRYQQIPLILDTDTNSRLIYELYGIQLVFSVGGQIGYFDWTTLLLTLVGASALLSVSTMGGEFFMLKVLPDKEFFNDVKYSVVKHDQDELDGHNSVPVGDDLPYHKAF